MPKRYAKFWNMKQQEHQNLEDFVNHCKMVGKRIEANEKAVIYVILNGLKPSLKTPLLQNDPQTIAQLLEFGTIIAYATLADPINTLAHTIKAMKQELHQIKLAIFSAPPQMIHISLKASKWYPPPSSSLFAQHPVTYQGKCNRSNTLEHTANNFDDNYSTDSQELCTKYFDRPICTQLSAV